MSGEATLDDPSLCYQDPGRLTGKLENAHCPQVWIWKFQAKRREMIERHVLRQFADPIRHSPILIGSLRDLGLPECPLVPLLLHLRTQPAGIGSRRLPDCLSPVIRTHFVQAFADTG
jgi:hypothetical protein